MNTEQCPCGAGQSYAGCCQPFIEAGAKPATALELMRARYVAYTLANIDYIVATHDPATIDDLNLEVARNWASQSTWLGLDIIECHAGSADDIRGTVEFKAHYRHRQKREQHHEVSEFVKHDGTWFYLDGRTPTITTAHRGEKIGRNQICPCGSGKKYKKCCA